MIVKLLVLLLLPILESHLFASFQIHCEESIKNQDYRKHFIENNYEPDCILGVIAIWTVAAEFA